MTTQTTNATIPPVDPTPQAPGQDPAGTPNAPIAGPAPTPEQPPAAEDLSSHEDPDLRDLAAAQAEVAKAGSGTPTPPEPTTPTAPPPPTGDQPAQAPQPAPTQGGAKPQPQVPMIPKPRLDAVLAEREAAIQAAAYWKGVAEGAKATPQGQPQPPTPQPPADPLAQIDARRLQLAQDFDDGKLSAAEWKKQEIELDRQATKLREESILARVPRAEQSRDGATDLLLEERTAQIAAKHPYATLVFPDQSGELDAVAQGRQALIREEAARNIVAQNPGLKPGPRADLLLIAEIARLSDTYGPIWFPDAKVQRPAPAPTAPAPRPGPTPQQRLDKLTLAGQQPPNTGSIGQQGGTTAITEQAISQMTDDEIAALPAAYRQRFTGVAT